MREILFRGKRVDNGEWVEGYYLVAAGIPFISVFAVREPIFVVPETVGQYTGLTDKNGEKIFEGDILRVETYWKKGNCVIKNVGDTEFEWVQPKSLTYWSVCYKNFRGEMGFFVYGIDRRFHKPLTWNRIYNSKAEVIGNIHDNPELLEEKE